MHHCNGELRWIGLPKSNMEYILGILFQAKKEEKDQYQITYTGDSAK